MALDGEGRKERMSRGGVQVPFASFPEGTRETRESQLRAVGLGWRVVLGPGWLQDHRGARRL